MTTAQQNLLVKIFNACRPLGFGQTRGVFHPYGVSEWNIARKLVESGMVTKRYQCRSLEYGKNNRTWWKSIYVLEMTEVGFDYCIKNRLG
jgi:hypothetical protein